MAACELISARSRRDLVAISARSRCDLGAISARSRLDLQDRLELERVWQQLRLRAVGVRLVAPPRRGGEVGIARWDACEAAKEELGLALAGEEVSSLRGRVSRHVGGRW